MAQSKTQNPLFIGSLVGVLVFVLGFGVVSAVKRSRDAETTPPSSTQSSPSESASSPGTSLMPRGKMPKTDPRLKAFYDQKLNWGACGANQCAGMKVPLNYADPGGEQITIAVLKVPARGQRIGSLVVNPGGPGASGAQYAAGGSLVFGDNVPDSFDLIGFDPRGVGSSDPLKCVSTGQLDAMIGADPDPDTRAERVELDRLVRQFGRGCLTKGGDLARHMSTVEVARDVDILRGVLGEPKLDWFGASYGTFLGATYANLFPTHVGRMVLDGAVNPALPSRQLSLQQAGGFETALRAYLADCVEGGDCILGGSVDAAAKKVRAVLDSVEANPLPGDGDRKLTAGTATIGIWLPLYVKDYWPQLTAALTDVIEKKDGAKLLALADQYNSRGPDGYTDNSINALYAVNCLDHSDSIPSSKVPAQIPAFEKVSPTFGAAFAYSLSTCAQWPVQSGKVTKAMAAKGAPPILVLGTTRDPATPYAWAKALASQLDSGILLTRDGDGHTAFNQGNDCIDRAVEAYLIDDVVPEDGKSC